MLVHVVKPSGTRFEYAFPDDFTSDKILAQLESIKGIFGFNGTVAKQDPTHPKKPVVNYGDPESGHAYDHEQTVVAIVRIAANGDVVEVKRLKGPEVSRPDSGGG